MAIHPDLCNEATPFEPRFSSANVSRTWLDTLAKPISPSVRKIAPTFPRLKGNKSWIEFDQETGIKSLCWFENDCVEREIISYVEIDDSDLL